MSNAILQTRNIHRCVFALAAKGRRSACGEVGPAGGDSGPDAAHTWWACRAVRRAPSGRFGVELEIARSNQPEGGRWRRPAPAAGGRRGITAHVFWHFLVLFSNESRILDLDHSHLHLSSF